MVFAGSPGGRGTLAPIAVDAARRSRSEAAELRAALEIAADSPPADKRLEWVFDLAGLGDEWSARPGGAARFDRALSRVRYNGRVFEVAVLLSAIGGLEARGRRSAAHARDGVSRAVSAAANPPPRKLPFGRRA